MSDAAAGSTGALEISVPADPTGPADARRALDHLRDAVDPDTFGTVELLVSELVTNSVRHGEPRLGGCVQLKVEVRPDMVRVEVTDPGSGFEPPTHPGPGTSAGGFGLYMVDQAAERWGVDRLVDGTRVWFDLTRG